MVDGSVVVIYLFVCNYIFESRCDLMGVYVIVEYRYCYVYYN